MEIVEDWLVFFGGTIKAKPLAISLSLLHLHFTSGYSYCGFFQCHSVSSHWKDVGLSILRRFLYPQSNTTKKPVGGKASKLAKRIRLVIACLDVRTNDKGDLVVTKGDQYDVREHTKENEVKNLGKPVDLAGQYYRDGADEECPVLDR